MQSATPLKQEERSSRLLPPIGNGEATHSGHNTPIVQKTGSEHKWSRYHAGCMVKHSLYLDWSAVRNERKMGGNYTRCAKTRSLASVKGNFMCFNDFVPRTYFNAGGAAGTANVEEQENVTHYLDNNKEFLDNYVSERVGLDVVEKWLAMKAKTHCTNQLSDNKTLHKQYKDVGNHKHIFMDLLKNLKDEPNEHTVLWELAKYITTSMGVDAYRLYKLFPDHPSFVQYFNMDHVKSPHKQPSPKILIRSEPQQVALVLDVAKAATCRRFSRFEDPTIFPEMPPSLFRAFGIKTGKTANYVMYQPILTKSGKTAYLIEMWRIRDRFKDVEEQISSNFMVWGSLALHYCNLYLDKKRERNMSDFLLDVVKAIFEEMVSLDQLIKRILEFAQRLVNADRASLFLVDYRNSELVSTVFDLKFEPGLDRDMEKKEIRMPINRGIAGYVALSGETMNIPDAYSDYRFNREVDEATGYKTINILCMPIKVEGRVIGVVQMVNKRSGDTFGHEDEAAFEIFSTFFGLALHHARLYDRIMRKEQKYRVALEVLSYHNTCRENEVQAMLGNKEPITVDLDNFYLDSFQLDEFQKCKCVITMFNDLFDLSKFDISTMTRFILTVKKNYRTVPYHNFDHGWSVAHAMYVIIKNDVRNRFDYKMRLALFVACICHDLDHRGYTNKYMSETASPLAAMYTTSTLEHHHFNITVTILQQDGHNIFSHITSQEYKEILSLIKHCILATDLAAFFPNLEKIKELFVEDKSAFTWSIPTHRDLAMAISMTAADLSASAKPWDIQIKTVKVIFEEFYDQGDKERAAGRVPIPMMDRHKPDEQPSSQVGFLSQICIPCYHMLYRILPNTKPMYSMAMKNLERWKARANEILRKIEEKKIKHAKENGEEIIKDLVNKDVRKEVVRKDTTVVEEKCRAVSWDEEEFANEEEVVRSGIWKDIDRVTWIEDDPVLKEETGTMDFVKIYKEKK